MIILLIFAFLSGLVTIAAPCIWPLLPIILSSSATGEKRKPLGITLGIMLSFTIFTLTLSYLVKLIPFDPNILRLFAVVVIAFFGFSLLIPQLNKIVEGWVSRLSAMFGNKMGKNGNGFGGGFLTGFALGIVWSPCAGPILATIAALAATTSVNIGVVLVTVGYVMGVGIPLFLFALLGSRIFTRTKALSRYTGKIQQVFGLIMIITALAIFTNYDKVVQAKLLSIFPSYSGFLNTLEANPQVQQQLNVLKGKKDMPIEKNMNKPLAPVQISDLPDLGSAPEFTGITKWLNTEKPVTLSDLKGKVVLVDFWTYTCINCIRTLPFVTRWYDKYKDKGFVVIGVHTPEFEFEKQSENVQAAIKQYAIHYPVAQDNDYATWNAYNNQYWPAEYLIDARGHVRRTHFGEGEYDQTEMYIKTLLEEAGQTVDNKTIELNDQTPTTQMTPETYLGAKRMERFASNEGVSGGKQTFTLSEPVGQDRFGYSGTWDVQYEYAKSFPNAKLVLDFYADKVHLVITPSSKDDKVKVLLDGKPVTAENEGSDVKNGYIQFNNDHMDDLYNVIDLHGSTENHLLELQFETGGTQVFAFTFG